MIRSAPRGASGGRQRLLVSALAACAVLALALVAMPSQPSPASDTRVSLSAGAGPSGTDVLLQLASDDGSPIDGARVRVRGTFSHHDHSDHSKPASIQQVSGTARKLGAGRYLVEGLDSEDGGEGLLEATATLPDGEIIKRSFVIPLPGREPSDQKHP
ncbi:MAG: hypothetical protein M3P70_15825 [Actinomycetota bacterium]|nr:hypothetical protein [Actinomycetota bacterium]